MRFRKENINQVKGLTLIEVLVAMVVLTILGGGLLSLQYILGQNQNLVLRSFINVDEANTNVSSFVREIRTARSGATGSYPLVEVDDFEIVFYSDYDFDGVAERIRYTLNGTTLEKGVIEPTTYPVSYPAEDESMKVVSENIRNGATPVFYYYNGDWPTDTENNPLVSTDRLADTRTVRMLLLLNTTPDDPKSIYELENYAQIRILKENL